MRGHPLYVYHKNLLDHIGTHSSFAIRPDRLPFPQCYDSMAKVWSIHPLERFNVRPSFHRLTPALLRGSVHALRFPALLVAGQARHAAVAWVPGTVMLRTAFQGL